jgi:hypothetical protein
MKSLLIATALLISVAGCAGGMRNDAKPDQAVATDEVEPIAPFSAGAVGSVPAQWEPMIIQRNKKLTEYHLVSDQGRNVLHARADSASSGLVHKVDIDPAQQNE